MNAANRYPTSIIIIIIIISISIISAVLCHSGAVVLTLVQTEQTRINIHKRNNTKTAVQTIQNTVIQVHILPKRPQL